MKMLKKVLVSLLVVTLILQYNLFVRATETEGYSIELVANQSAVSAGETVEVTLVFDNITVGEGGIGAYIGVIEYDTNAFELVSIKGTTNWEDPTTRAKAIEEGSTKQVIALMSDTKSGEGYTTRQEVAVITLKALANSVVGNSTIRADKFTVTNGFNTVIANEHPSIDIRVKGVTITSITSENGIVTIPSEEDGRTVTDIGSKVVTDIDNVTTITIPNTIVEIADDAFQNSEGQVPDKVTIECYEGSTAEQYAIDHNIKYELIGKTVQSIKVVDNTLKTEYSVGETVDITGGQLELTYTGGKKSIISMNKSGIEISGFNSTLGGTNTVTVTYKNKTTTYDVEIVKALSSIAVKTIPNKTNYFIGDEINLADGVITLTYNDNTTEDIDMTAEGVTVSGFDNTTIGEQEVTITYGGKTATFIIQMGILGDVDGSGVVDITDILKLKRHLLAILADETEGDWILPEKLRYLGDMDNDGELTLTDALQIKYKTLDDLNI